MNKNVKRMFFVATLLVLLVGVTAVSASDVADDTTLVEDSDQTVAPTDVATTTTSDNSVETAKTIEKEDKNLKTATKTVEVNNVKELNTAIRNSLNDDENESYIINLNNGTYSASNFPLNVGKYSKNITINCNNQNISGNYFRINNGCNMTINQLIISIAITNGNSVTDKNMNLILNQVILNKNLTNYINGNLTIKDSTIYQEITNHGNLTIENMILDSAIVNNGLLIITDDVIIGEEFSLSGSGSIIINDTSKVIEFINLYNGDYTLTNKNISSEKTNLGNLTLVECNVTNKLTNEGKLNLTNTILNATINNTGVIYIDDDTSFGENAQIIGLGEIVTNDITRLLPYIETISGNYTITDTTLDKTYNFNGNITLENCNITSIDNVNYGVLNLVNTDVYVDDEANWITNYGLITIDEQSTTTGNITNYGELFTGSLPEDYTYDPTYHVVNNDTIKIYFDITKGNVLSKLVNEGDTLDFQGTIGGIPVLSSLVIDKPVNIITSTNDGRIENFSSITYNNGASGSNITGLYTYNTQFYVRNAHNIVFDNISNVVNSARIGWGVGQTSIGHNSTNITVKNSYFYTKDNGGSSTFVFNWADNSTLINSTVEADGNVGNLIYLTTYNVDIPSGTTANCNNQILNNIIIGPETPAAICWGIVLSGANNNIANNRIYYKGNGIVNQWGSGITGEGVDSNETSLVTIENNTLTNNTHIRHKPTNELIIDTTTFTPGKTTTITATIRFTNQILTDITKGKVTFKVDGKTLKDANGKVIYVKIVNGTATIENYTVPDTWKEGSTIQAIYSGSTQCDKLNSEKTEITLNKEAPTFIIDPVEPATIGDTITLKATITDNDKVINSGKVVFKINGKTVKDANGKVIYAKVINGQVSVNYTIPDSYKRGNYTLTATYIGTDYDKLTSESTINVVNP